MLTTILTTLLGHMTWFLKSQIEISTEKIPTVVKELALGNAGIKAVIPKEHSLEEIFFDATKGGKKWVK